MNCGYDTIVRSYDASVYKFTGKERDIESGLDYFGARYYASSMGRWMSPDWSAKPEAVPYSDIANPQSLNLYGYADNNPISKADDDGHDVILMVWATHDYNYGHAAVAVSNYKSVTVNENGHVVTRMVPDGTYTYKDFWPAASAGSVGVSNYSKPVAGDYQTMSGLSMSDLTNGDPSGREGRAPDGVLKIDSGYEKDMATLAGLSSYQAANPSYIGDANNCSTFASQGPSLDLGMNFGAISTETGLGTTTITPNALWNSVVVHPQASVIKDPGDKVDHSFINGVTGGSPQH